ncbi:GNAT family N-acetyltransferase [Actinoalloteichus sp. AHMU CJ021]|uniref:Nodulation protein A n=1 Tax=Actinoalloteichus caeruleus DSM 43889 TaxID=1120930 RepID=A0ABT1JPY5_ACTCY|nr:GNAT family N-acetyltransferase [Actinoalloteichus caeruleus]AUS80345.1 GNAT family N-acetyltransferase [Actinoalloteichus sp. AHMU CJ021]MCP2334600.1 nodulation protein A [Actinoalloteichus caeruleus DSM 43889]
MSVEEPHWFHRWEGELAPLDHLRIAELLSAAFASTSHHFRDARSWAGARPELRLGARVGEAVVAHAAVLRRFVRVGETDQLVAEVGLVAVHPDAQGNGLGAQLLARVEDRLRLLGVPFGLLNTDRTTATFYARSGWSVLTGVASRWADPDYPWRHADLRDPLLVLPVAAPLTRWPGGDVVDRNGGVL